MQSNTPLSPSISAAIQTSDGFLRKDESVFIHGDHIPHWNQNDTFVFITFRLKDSLPKAKREEFKMARDNWIKNHPKPWDERTELEFSKLFTHKLEQLLDMGYGSCLLKIPEVAQIVEEAIKHSHSEKFDLKTYVIMPNHVHVLIRLIEENKVEDILQGWKSVSSHLIRKEMGKEWCGWMPKYHDRIIRNEDHYKNVCKYIEKNYRYGGVRGEEVSW